jgi:hypothetical protein
VANLREVRILKEQLAALSKTNRVYCVVRQKNMRDKDIFNYENVYKITKNKSIGLLPNNKIKE